MTSQKSFFNNGKKLIFGHRGFSGNYPENTLVSFQSALDAGAIVLELDVHLSKDNKLMVIHDKTLDRTTNGSGKINNFTSLELGKFNAGCKFSISYGKEIIFPFREKELPVPSLEELFEKFPEAKFNVDLKQHDKKTCETFLTLIKDFNMEEKVLAASDDFETINYFRKISGGKTATGASYREILSFLLSKNKLNSRWFPFEADALQIPEKYFGIRILTEKLIQEAHKKNVEVHAWVINKKEDITRLFNWGIDGIMSDFPDVCFKTLKEIQPKNLLTN